MRDASQIKEGAERLSDNLGKGERENITLGGGVAKVPGWRRKVAKAGFVSETRNEGGTQNRKQELREARGVLCSLDGRKKRHNRRKDFITEIYFFIVKLE